MLIYIIPCAVVLAIFLLLFIFALICENIAWGRRYDKNPLLKYFTADDFNLLSERVFLQGGLNGFIYSKNAVPQKDKLVIFCHGMGAGHLAHMTEIAYLCDNGFAVLAIDVRGCNFSKGKNVKGTYSGVQTALSAINFAKKNEFKNIYLVGHSWGGYSVLCASAQARVNGVIALGAPDTPSKIMQTGVVNAGVPRLLSVILRPFWWLINLFKFGLKGNSSAGKCANKSRVPTLLIHGDKDNLVPLNKSAFSKARGENVKKILAKGKRHNPYNTNMAEELLAELVAKLKSGDTGAISKFDFKGATEQDEQIMQTILSFINDN